MEIYSKILKNNAYLNPVFWTNIIRDTVLATLSRTRIGNSVLGYF